MFILSILRTSTTSNSVGYPIAFLFMLWLGRGAGRGHFVFLVNSMSRDHLCSISDDYSLGFILGSFRAIRLGTGVAERGERRMLMSGAPGTVYQCQRTSKEGNKEPKSRECLRIFSWLCGSLGS